MKKAVRDLLQKSMEYSTFHAIPNIARAEKSSIKTIWLIILLLSSATCGFLVIKTLNQYLRYEVTTKLDVVYEIPTKFPTVSICNANAFVTDEAFKFVSSLTEKYNLSSVMDENPLKDLYSSEFLQVMNSNAMVKYYVQILSANEQVSDDVKKKFGLRFDELVLGCMFKGKECTEEDFVWFYDVYYGNCFRFNSGKFSNGSKSDLKTTSQAGMIEGLQLVLYVGIPNNTFTFSSKVGAHVYIHNASVATTPYEGIDLPSGFLSNIVVNREFTYKLPLPFNECYENLEKADDYDSVLYEAIINMNHSYRQKDCFRLCFQKAVIETCGCYDVTNPPLFRKRPCSQMKEILCSQDIFLKFWEQDVMKNCSKLCPLECNSVSYSLMTSYSDIVTPSSIQLFSKVAKIRNRFKNQDLTYELVKKNYLMMNVFYQETKYLKIEEQESMSWIDMISNIGGTLGLFLGISFLSFIEFLEFVLELAFLFRSLDGNKQNTKQSPAIK